MRCYLPLHVEYKSTPRTVTRINLFLQKLPIYGLMTAVNSDTSFIATNLSVYANNHCFFSKIQCIVVLISLFSCQKNRMKVFTRVFASSVVGAATLLLGQQNCTKKEMFCYLCIMSINLTFVVTCLFCIPLF